MNGDVARLRLGTFPTPIHRSPALGAALGIDHLWLKRDDLTGFSWGGNKVRSVEFIVGEAAANGVNELVVSGGPSSNFVPLLAAAAATVGIHVHQVSYGFADTQPTAAMRASDDLGVSRSYTESTNRSDMDEMGEALADDRRGFGHVAWAIPRGGATATGALGFALAAQEVEDQFEQAGLEPSAILMPVGSGGSISGLLAGMESIGANWPVVGASVSRSPQLLEDSVVDSAVTCSERLGVPATPERLRDRMHLGDARGSGFGTSDPLVEDLRSRVQTRTGLLFDPVYNGKALHWLSEGHDSLPVADAERPIVYWHTGGILGCVGSLMGNSPSAGPSPLPSR